MSEEVKELNDGTFSGLKKTIIGTLGTLVTAGGVWISTTIFQGSEEKEETKTEQVATPAPAPVVVNIQNTNQQKQTSGGTNTIIKEKVVEKPVASAPAEKEKKSETEDAPW
jgi:flagellar basal body-associated protein FliL